MTSDPHKHRDWLMDLLTVRMFGRIDLNPKNKRFALSQHDIHILCENTHAHSAVQQIFSCANYLNKKDVSIFFGLKLTYT